MKTKILFVCLGNICRSPMAESVMKKYIEDAGLSDKIEVDSAGIISYHQGESPDRRMREHAFQRGYTLNHRSRPITTKDFETFDLIIGMDDSNIDALRQKAFTLEEEQKIKKMTDFCTDCDLDYVPDPYYGGSEGFKLVIDLLENSCGGLLKKIQ